MSITDGRLVWRLRIPGRFPPRSARLMVDVDGVDVGPGLESPGLDALMVVMVDPTALVDGATVSYRVGAEAPTVVGLLEVIQ